MGREETDSGSDDSKHLRTLTPQGGQHPTAQQPLSSQAFVSLSLTMYPSSMWPFFKETPVPLASSFLVRW